MIYDYSRVTGAHDSVLDYGDLFSVTLRDGNIQEFDTRWDEVSLSMSKNPTDDTLESLHKLRIRESDQLKTLVELYDMEIHQRTSVPNYQKLKTVEKERKTRNFDCETLTPGTGKLKQEQWSRIEWAQVALEEKVSDTSGKKKTSIRKENVAVSDARVMIVQNRHQKPLHPLSHQHQEVEVRRASEAEASLGCPTDSRAKTSLRVPALNYLVTVGILPNVSKVSPKRDVNSAWSAHFRTGRLRNNPAKSR